jgi:hypothetical protein
LIASGSLARGIAVMREGNWRGFLSLRDPAALPGRPGHPTARSVAMFSAQTSTD